MAGTRRGVPTPDGWRASRARSQMAGGTGAVTGPRTGFSVVSKEAHRVSRARSSVARGPGGHHWPPYSLPVAGAATFRRTAPVAQMDRASAFEAAGRGFDSLRARQFLGFTVSIAQSVEHWTVDPGVKGSSPFTHPP